MLRLPLEAFFARHPYFSCTGSGAVAIGQDLSRCKADDHAVAAIVTYMYLPIRDQFYTIGY